MKTRENFMPRVIHMGYGTTSPQVVSTASVSFTITGQPVSLKNRRRLLKSPRTKKIFSAKSEDAERYIQDFCSQVPMAYRNLRLGSLRTPLRLIASVFYLSRHSDPDIAIVLDSLQASGVIRNDRYVIEYHVYSGVDKKNPRVELTLEEL